MPDKLRKKKLTEAQKAFVIRCLACGFGPQDTANFVKDEFDIRINRADVCYYAKTRRAEIEELATEIVEDLERLPFARKERRVALLDRLVMKHFRGCRYKDVAAVLEQIAKEVGGIVHRHEVAGQGGKDLIPRPRPDLSHYTDEELRELQAIHERAEARRDQSDSGG